MANWIDRTQRLTSGGLKLFFAPQLSVGFRPVRGLLANFVQTIAMFLATARLIPVTHRALRPMTPADARLGEVLALAYVNVRRPGVRVDQVAVFGAVISLMVLLSIVLFGAIMGMMIGSANAAFFLTVTFSTPACGFGGATSFFSVSCSTDMAQQWIDMLLLGKSSWFAAQITSFGMRTGLENMFETYSYAMLIVAGFLVMYHLLGIVAGTAHSGKVGGGLMHSIWAPLRLILAIGMLVPVGVNGLNSGQLVVTQVAKWGSALGSNVWMAFASGFSANAGIMLIAPPLPQVTPLLHDALKILVCEVGYNKIAAASGGSFSVVPTAWTTIPGSTDIMKSFDYESGVGTDGEPGVCGAVHMPDPSYTPSGIGAEYLGGMLSIASAPAIRSALLSAHANALENQMTSGGTLYTLAEEIYDSADSANTGNDLTLTELLTFNDAVLEYRTDLGVGIVAAITATGMTSAAMVADATQRGWVSAAVWFNTIARVNGMLVDYAQEVPVATPNFEDMAQDGTLDTIVTALQSVDQSLVSMVTWSPSASVTLEEPDYLQAIGGSSGGGSAFESQLKIMAANFAKILGTTTNSNDELSVALPAIASSLRLNTANPLAELSAMGNRIIMLAFQTVKVLDDCKKQAAAAAAAAATKSSGNNNNSDNGGGSCGGSGMGSMGSTFMAIIGGSIISAGVTLAYVLPMIPFIRFMFGILSWILTLFESVIAIPVVALAHISMDGEGLSGPMARGAYLLLLQLFVRPTLMIFGLIIALLVFNLMIVALNEFYSMAVRSAEGGGSMSAVAGVVYTVMYGALAYAFANASFKAIDQVPEQVLRWIGGNQVSGVDGTQQVMGAVSQTASVGSHAVSAINRNSALSIASRV